MACNLITYDTRDLLFSSLALIVKDQLEDALTARDQATLAVPGGTTPAPFLQDLSHVNIAWDDVLVMLTDERYVPVSSSRSNARLLQKTLLKNNASVAQFLPFYHDGQTTNEATDELNVIIKKRLPLDVCVLGMGLDMHTASLFPDADRLTEGLDETSDVSILPMVADGASEPRMTLTVNALRSARHLHLLIVGEEKKHALEQALECKSWREAPVRAVLTAPQGIDVHYAR